MTLVLLHSAGATPEIWDRVRGCLVGVPVIAPPLPGRADAGEPADDVAVHGDAVLRVMDREGIDRAAIGGHSLGGAVALWLAINHPRRVAGLGLVNAGGRMRVAPQMLEALPDGLEPILDMVALSNFPSGSPSDWVEERRKGYRAVGGATLLADLTACDRFDVLDRLWEIRCRTQVLAGSEDSLTPPRHAKMMAERISAARYVEYAGAGHMLPIERAAEIAGELAVLWASTLDGPTRGRGAPASGGAGSLPRVG
ncbi:MAG TPA: alpha/beta fold hydrolase [Actinomycetota bacterium]|nr:alpha/beta fold hydrolase [Actinomycetota bacterium]